MATNEHIKHRRYSRYSSRTRRLRNWNVTFLSHLLHDLGRHPAGRPDERVPDLLPAEIPAGRQPGAHPEVRYLHCPVLAQQDVARLDIPDYMRQMIDRIHCCYACAHEPKLERASSFSRPYPERHQSSGLKICTLIRAVVSTVSNFCLLNTWILKPCRPTRDDPVSFSEVSPARSI